MQIYESFRPITAEPFRRSDAYVEIQPCRALRPYIRCFWGSRVPVKTVPVDALCQGIVTPDLCADIIFRVNYSKNRIESGFCGVNDTLFRPGAGYGGDLISTFAVRFYAWSAVLFTDENLHGTKNQFYDAGVFFETFKRRMEAILFDVHSLEDRILAAEKYLLYRLNTGRMDSLLARSIGEMIRLRGNLRALEMATDLHISSRQMERIFDKNTGLTPKKMAALIRYQFLWQEVCRNRQFQVLDAVCKYGYTDQAHLLNDFRKIHGMNIRQARAYAWRTRSVKGVENLQDAAADHLI